MNRNDKLISIHNALMQIQTSGEGTILMGECLKALRGVIKDDMPTNDVPAVNDDSEH